MDSLDLLNYNENIIQLEVTSHNIEKSIFLLETKEIDKHENEPSEKSERSLKDKLNATFEMLKQWFSKMKDKVVNYYFKLIKFVNKKLEEFKVGLNKKIDAVKNRKENKMWKKLSIEIPNIKKSSAIVNGINFEKLDELEKDLNEISNCGTLQIIASVKNISTLNSFISVGRQSINLVNPKVKFLVAMNQNGLANLKRIERMNGDPKEINNEYKKLNYQKSCIEKANSIINKHSRYVLEATNTAVSKSYKLLFRGDEKEIVGKDNYRER